MAFKIKRSVLLPVQDKATLGFVADASELGLKAGRWPAAMELEDEPGVYKQTGIIRQHGSVLAAAYELEDKSRWLKVYND
jgi:hypothetical protein